MKFSLQLPTDRVENLAEFGTAEAIAEIAKATEAAGFDASFVTEHPFPTDEWLSSGGHHALDPFVSLAVAASATTSLLLHTNILVLAYRNPFLTAKAVASLDAISGGRVIVGVGAGYLEGEFAALGADFKNRNDVSDDALVAMQAAWTGESVSLSKPGADLDRREQSARDPALGRLRPGLESVSVAGGGGRSDAHCRDRDGRGSCGRHRANEGIRGEAGSKRAARRQLRALRSAHEHAQGAER